MANLLHMLLRILAGIAGCLLLYVAFFLYEDEEARLQNRLEQIWSRINELEKAAMSQEVAFLQGAMRTTSAILDNLLGDELLSKKSIAVSMAFSTASLFIWLAFFTITAFDTTRFRTSLLFYAIFVFVLAILPTFADRFVLRPLGRFLEREDYYVDLIFFVIWSTFLAFRVWANAEIMVFIVFLQIAVLFGVVLDVLFIAFFRWVLTKLVRVSSFWIIISCFIAITGMTALLAGPAVVLTTPSLSARFAGPLMNTHWWLAGLASFTCMTNLIDAACMLLLTLIVALLLAHRLLWPLLKRPVYAANRKQLIRNTKLLGALGTMLLLYAFPNIAIVKWITHFLPNMKGG